MLSVKTNRRRGEMLCLPAGEMEDDGC